MSARKLLTVAGVAVVAVALSTAAFAEYDVQQKYRNDCGVFVDGLTKVIKPAVDIDNAIHDLCASHTSTRDDLADTTTLRFTDCSVDPGQSTWACFDYTADEASDQIQVIDAYWTLGGIPGIPECNAGAPVGGNRSYDDPGGTGLVDATILIGNDFDPSQLTGGPFPIDGSNVQWTSSLTRFPLDQLTEALLIDPDLEWSSLGDFTLPYQSTQQYVLTAVPTNHYLIMYMETGESITGDNPTIEMFQWPTPVEATVPTLTEWGVMALILLLIAVATVMIVRRRSVTTT